MGDHTKDQALGLAVGNEQKLCQPCCPPLHNHTESPVTRGRQLGNEISTPPLTRWTKELVLNKMVSDVRQILDYLYTPSGP